MTDGEAEAPGARHSGLGVGTDRCGLGRLGPGGPPERRGAGFPSFPPARSPRTPAPSLLRQMAG